MIFFSFYKNKIQTLTLNLFNLEILEKLEKKIKIDKCSYFGCSFRIIVAAPMPKPTHIEDIAYSLPDSSNW